MPQEVREEVVVTQESKGQDIQSTGFHPTTTFWAECRDQV